MTAKATLATVFNSRRPGCCPISRIAADLNHDNRPEIIAGCVDAPGLIYFNG